MMATIQTLLVYVFGFAILFGVLVFLHELGHFVIAKWLGFEVEVFSLGFGPRVWGFRRRETEYRISLIPLGGYVRVAGQDRMDELRDPNPRAFYNRPLWQQFTVVVAGGVINLLLGPVLIGAAYWVGFNEPAFLRDPAVVAWVFPGSPAAAAGVRTGDRIVRVGDRSVQTWQDVQSAMLENLRTDLVLTVQREGRTRKVHIRGVTRPRTGQYFYGFAPFPPAVVDAVEPDTPAHRGGMRPGDVIFRVDGRWILNVRELQGVLRRAADRAVELHVFRNGTVRILRIRPFYDARLNMWRLGIRLRSPVQYVRVRYSIGDALARGVHETVWSAGLFFRAVRNILTGELSIRTLSGPIEIARFAGSALLIGIATFLRMMGLISVQLGIINLLPIPALDGGHAAMILISGLMRTLFGRPLSPRIREWVTIIGVALLIGLTILVISLDIIKVRGGG